MAMPAWNDIPDSEPLGGGYYMMDIAPEAGCLSCGEWSWEKAVVNTSKRCDLLTNRALHTWSVKSECRHCGIHTLWNVDPDKPYPKATDDPFSK